MPSSYRCAAMASMARSSARSPPTTASSRAMCAAARSTRLRPILQPANTVRGEWRARSDAQLAALTVEPVESRGRPAPRAARRRRARLGDGAGRDGAARGAALSAASCGAGGADRCDRGGAGGAWLGGGAGAVRAAAARRTRVRARARSLHRDRRRGRAGVREPAQAAARCRAARRRDMKRSCCRYPGFLVEGGAADWPAVFDALALTGHFLARDVLVDRRAAPLAARERLVRCAQEGGCVSAARAARRAPCPRPHR